MPYSVNTLQTVRFEEYGFYDPIEDCRTTRITAVTNVGTWYLDIPEGSAIALRAYRDAFKKYMLTTLALENEPRWVAKEELDIA